MAEKEEDSWLWIGVIAAAVVIIAFFGIRYFQSIKASTGEGAYYSNDSIDALIAISFQACGSIALDPEMVQDKMQAYDQHMRTRHAQDMQECLSYAEKFQNTQDPYWKSQYDTKVKSICVHTLDNIQVPRRHSASLGGGGGSTGNIIPAISDVY